MLYMLKSDDQLSLRDVLEAVKAQDKRAQGILYAFLEKACYHNIERYLLKKGGKKEDAEDCFQQAILVLFSAIAEEKFALNQLSIKSHTNQLCSYLMAVSKNLWRKELRWRNRAPVSPKDSTEEILLADMPAGLVAEAFQSMGEACKTLLSMYFREKLSAAKIAGRLGDKTEAVKKQLATCIDEMVKAVGSVLGSDQQEKLFELLNQGMEDLEGRCKEILTSFYFNRQSMSAIADKMGYANARSVTEQKNRCMKRLNEAIVNRMMNDKQI